VKDSVVPAIESFTSTEYNPTLVVVIEFQFFITAGGINSGRSYIEYLLVILINNQIVMNTALFPVTL
jgi:hypothetical protein